MGRTKKAYLFTKTRKGDIKKRKEELIGELVSNLDEYNYVYVVTFMKMSHVQALRLKLQDSSKIFLTKKSLVRHAFEESKKGEELMKLCSVIRNEVMVIYSSKKPEEMTEFLSNYYENDTPLPESLSPTTLTLKTGKLPGFFWHDEEFFAVNAIPIKIIDKEMHITTPYTVCKKGEKLTPKQTKIINKLKSSDEVTSDPSFPWVSFRFIPLAVWSRLQNKYSQLASDEQINKIITKKEDELVNKHFSKKNNKKNDKNENSITDLDSIKGLENLVVDSVEDDEEKMSEDKNNSMKDD